jgi:hypothetical protein
MGIFDEGYQQSILDTHDNWLTRRRPGLMEWINA